MDYYKIIKNEIKEAFIENKIIITISFLIFFIPLIIAYIFVNDISHIFQPVVSELSEDIKQGVIQINFETIFLNNVSILIKEYFMGVFLFVFSAFLLGYNGLFLGYYLGVSDNLARSLIFIIPHGIFEFFAIIISASGGFLLCIFILNLIYNIIYQENKNLSLKDRIYNSIEKNYLKFKHSLILFGISLIAMAIAGLIEVYITPILGELILVYLM
ncbi:stage II sporulation protein M [Methanobrevibacter sp. DSM 116169]|uniref:stage II sporulation protein M n=1 Tax=Methanobrevibacter sp. DSM 116169 TaxID=3242727 RepID=UPI0038FD0559